MLSPCSINDFVGGAARNGTAGGGVSRIAADFMVSGSRESASCSPLSANLHPAHVLFNLIAVFQAVWHLGFKHVSSFCLTLAKSRVCAHSSV